MMIDARQKEIAIQCLEKLDIYKPYINKFKSQKTLPCFFENFGGFWVDQEPELFSKIKEVEHEFGCLVYAVTHELTDFGECWSMLCVTKDAEEVSDVLGTFNSQEYYAFAYVWNVQNEIFSEFGDIVIISRFGGIKRIH
jgi:hypothetical protein